MNTRDKVKMLGIDERKVDYALPQDWFDRFTEVMGHPPRNFVWSFENGSIFGFPRPLTSGAMEELRIFNEEVGARQPESFRVIKS